MISPHSGLELMWYTSKSVYRLLYFTHLGQLIFVHIFYISCPILFKLCIWCLHTELSNLCDFLKNWFVESYTSVMGLHGNLCFLPKFNITHKWYLHTKLSIPFSSCPQMDCLSVVQSVLDTLHFLYRHVYHEDGGSCFFTFQMFPPTLWQCNTKEEEKSTLYKCTMY